MRKLAKTAVLGLKQGKQAVIVVSAMGKATDMLASYFQNACENKSMPKELDEVLSMGERISARLFAAALNAHGTDARYFDPLDADWPLITDDDFGNAKPILDECVRRIENKVLPMLEKGITPVVPGFVGKTLKGEVTTLGRGGSEITAFVLARAIKAKEVVIITDVDGIMTADPNIVSNSKRLRSIGIGELVNLCDSGAKFIRRKALKYLDGSFEVRVRGNRKSKVASQGTVVKGRLPEKPNFLGYPSAVCMVTIVGKAFMNKPKVLANIFERINSDKVPILAQSFDTDAAQICFPEEWIEETVKAIHSGIIQNKLGSAMALRKQLAFLKIVGVGSENTTKTLRRVTESLDHRRVSIAGICIMASSILFFVDWAEKDAALAAIEEGYEAC
jgi:aspartate kinase